MAVRRAFHTGRSPRTRDIKRAYEIAMPVSDQDVITGLDNETRDKLRTIRNEAKYLLAIDKVNLDSKGLLDLIIFGCKIMCLPQIHVNKRQWIESELGLLLEKRKKLGLDGDRYIESVKADRYKPWIKELNGWAKLVTLSYTSSDNVTPPYQLPASEVHEQYPSADSDSESESEDYSDEEDDEEDDGDDIQRVLTSTDLDSKISNAETSNTCSSHECVENLATREERRTHALCCPATCLRSSVVRPDLPLQVSRKVGCEHCDEKFYLQESLDMHASAKHKPAYRLCTHSDCEGQKELYSDWELNVHVILTHDAAEHRCFFPGCRFKSHAKLATSRKRSLLQHLGGKHGLYTTSWESLRMFNLEEVENARTMDDPGKTYMVLQRHVDTSTLDIDLRLPSVLLENSDLDDTGYLENGPPSVFKKLAFYAEFRKQTEIYQYNLDELRSLSYDGTLKYRKGTSLCEEHALELVDWSVLRSPVRASVEKILARGSDFDICTPIEATRFLADTEMKYTGMTPEETQFLRDLRDQRNVFFTDTETVGTLLVQVSVVDAKRNTVFSSYIHHGCKTVRDIWALASERVGRKLHAREAKGLRRAFGSPSENPPEGHDVPWLARQWEQLLNEFPDMQVAEWSTSSCDEKIMRKTLHAAGYDLDNVLPAPDQWKLPLLWMRSTRPSLPGYSLGYVCSLFAPSPLVWAWHDSLVDSLMMYDLLKIRQQKLFDKKRATDNTVIYCGPMVSVGGG
ncbi:hypothetical protein FIE12Z_2926 [Fusarium flagelliforme]|uniref:C2H2-type domain-containing protein n=1 Tax=Fusarium flagelliforme TaxID=2675880 RepID=A0A395MYF2_9HYPO|nr:hypothetical protein FIE12Z_2926 [Fusarium flagelliforme]